MSKYIVHNGQLYNSDELMHYGVKGMKWGVRRDAELLANHYHNQRRRKIKEDYDTGKISSEQKKSQLKASRYEKKKYLADIKSKYEGAKSDAERTKISSSIVGKTTREVPSVNLKRGLTVANRILTGVALGATAASGVGTAVTAATYGGATLGAMYLGAAAVNSASVVGDHYIRKHILNVTA